MRIRDHIVSVLLVTVSLAGVACSHDEPRASDPSMASSSSGGAALNAPRTSRDVNQTSDPMGGNETNFVPSTPATTTYNTAGAGTVNPTADAYGTPIAPSSSNATGMGGYEATNPDPVRNPNPALPVDTGVATDVTGSSGTNLGGNVPAARPVAPTTRRRTVTHTTTTNATH